MKKVTFCLCGSNSVSLILVLERGIIPILPYLYPMKHLPVGRQNFEEIIKENLLYVDKTRQMYELINRSKLYFLSRPRRFGKSLLVSIFKYLFSGRKDLFENLYIGRETDYDWQAYPVLQFNFASFGHEVEQLEEVLKFKLEELAGQFGVDISAPVLSTQFRLLVEKIAQKGQPVVVLIDEYDKPIIDFLTEPEKAQKNQKILRDFFSPLKDLDANGQIRFLFITGVSKFSKVSLFSDLNNLTDLTIHSLSHDLLGITHEELVENFELHIKYAKNKFNVTEEKLLKGIKTWYNGYSYNAETFLYNPFSLLQFFLNNHFKNYWFATGTPTFLVNTIREKNINPQELEGKKVAETFFEKFSLENLDMTGLLFQTGYLTIKKTQTRDFETDYYLNYPNQEVRKSMMHNLVEAFTYKHPSTVSHALVSIRDGLDEGKVEVFIDQLKTILADISYHWHPKSGHKSEAELFLMWEGYFHSIIYLLLSYMEVDVKAELTQHKGRLDLLAETADFLYVMEFKLDGSTQRALEQIKEKAYPDSFKNSPKTVYLVGINFSKTERNVASWEAEIWERD